MIDFEEMKSRVRVSETKMEMEVAIRGWCFSSQVRLEAGQVWSGSLAGTGAEAQEKNPTWPWEKNPAWEKNPTW